MAPVATPQGSVEGVGFQSECFNPTANGNPPPLIWSARIITLTLTVPTRNSREGHAQRVLTEAPNSYIRS
eukprot:1394529-Amorphochlora_amoeboformis.AAC.2